MTKETFIEASKVVDKPSKVINLAYLQQKDEINQLELLYTMNRIEKEFTKCAFIVALEDNLFIPYKLRHIMKFPKENADIQLKELACEYSIIVAIHIIATFLYISSII